MESHYLRRVGVLVGSLRRASLSRRVAAALVARAPGTLDCHTIEIGRLPLYNEDLDAAPPAPWVAFRKAVARCDALLFVTSEYNRSVPGCLKNATDVGSRPEGENVFAGLPAAVVSVSPYATGGFGVNHALRQNFVYLDLAVMQQPEAYIGDVTAWMDDSGTVTDGEADERLIDLMQAFDAWVRRVQRAGEDFGDFMARREAASQAWIGGDAKPLLALSTTDDPATFFAPDGRRVLGASAVNAANGKGARAFAAGGEGHFEVLQSGAGGGLGFWAGIQHAEMVVKGRKGRVQVQLRTTEVFRLERGQWKLVHRHADTAGTEA